MKTLHEQIAEHNEIERLCRTMLAEQKPMLPSMSDEEREGVRQWWLARSKELAALSLKMKLLRGKMDITICKTNRSTTDRYVITPCER